jgi:phage terminase small subunit
MGRSINPSVTSLPPKRERFCQEYAIDHNGTQAAIRAKYSEHTAQEQSAELLSIPLIQNRITEIEKQFLDKLGISKERVLKEYSRLAFTTMRDVASWNGETVNLDDSKDLTEDSAAAVMEVSQTTNESGSSVKIKLHDKKAALDKLGEYLKLSGGKDNEARGPTTNIFNIIDPSQRATVEKIQASANNL